MIFQLSRNHFETPPPTLAKRRRRRRKQLILLFRQLRASFDKRKLFVEGWCGTRQGRQRKRWEDNIREWTGLEFANSQRAVENQGKWRKLVAKSSPTILPLLVKPVLPPLLSVNYVI